MSNIKTNMQYREYLMNNADNIIKYNQIVSHTNCSTTQILQDNYSTDQSLKLVNTITTTSLPIEYNSGDSALKINHLNKYYTKANLSAPNFKLNTT